MYGPNLKSIALPVPEIGLIANEVLSGAVANTQSRNPQSWGTEERTYRVSGMVPFERALAISYRPSMHSNFFSIFTGFRDIAAFVLQHATFSSLPKNFPMFPQ